MAGVCCEAGTGHASTLNMPVASYFYRLHVVSLYLAQERAAPVHVALLFVRKYTWH